jgi:hypothetical protein
MNGVNVRDFRGADDSVNAKIAFAAGALADANRFIGELHMHGVGVRLGVDRNRADIELLARPDDAHGNLTTVGDQYFFEHGVTRPGR